MQRQLRLKQLLCLFILIPILARSQGPGFSIYTTPTTFIDFYGGANYRLGSEIRLVKQYSLKLEGGGYFKHFNGLENVKGIALGIELKRYSASKPGSYFSLNLFAKNQSFNWLTDTIRIDPDYNKPYRIDKHLWAVSLKYGKARTYNSGIVFDWFVGLGVRYKTVTADLTLEEIKHRDPGDSQIVPFMTSVGHRVVPNFIAGFTLGYRIK